MQIDGLHRRSSSYFPSPRFFFIEDNRTRYQPFPIAIRYIEVLKSRLERGGDEAKHSCKKISSARKVTLRRIDQREYQALLLLC